MDTYLIPACLVLFLTTISSLVQAAYWRRRWRTQADANIRLSRQAAGLEEPIVQVPFQV